jgi:chromosome partitioning related protein ParA
MRLKFPIHHSPYMRDEGVYDVVIIDSPGAVSALQDAAVVAAGLLISPVVPETLSAREFLEGTNDLIQRLSRSAVMMNIELGVIRGLVYRQNRTVDAKVITNQIRENFIKLGGKVDSFKTTVPATKAYTEATTKGIPVHMHDHKRTGATPCGYEVMHQLVYEIIPSLADHGVAAPVSGAVALGEVS